MEFSFPILSVILFIPLVGAVLVLLVRLAKNGCQKSCSNLWT